MGDEVFCLSETKNCERLEARGVEGPEQNSQTLPQESSVVCVCGLMSAKENTETNQTEFLRVVLDPGQVLFLVCCPVVLAYFQQVNPTKQKQWLADSWWEWFVWFVSSGKLQSGFILGLLLVLLLE